MKINKLMLSKLIAKQYGTSLVLARKMVDMVSDTVMSQVTQGHNVSFGNMGVFKATQIKSRRAINPTTQEIMILPRAIRTKFRESLIMRRMMDNLR